MCSCVERGYFSGATLPLDLPEHVLKNVIRFVYLSLWNPDHLFG